MEKRSEQRISNGIRFFVHLNTCETNPDLVGKSFSCEAVDFSHHGLQFRMGVAIPAGSLVYISIGVGNPFSMFLLQGEVRWARQIQEESFMGVLLQDCEGTDFNNWQEKFDQYFN